MQNISRFSKSITLTTILLLLLSILCGIAVFDISSSATGNTINAAVERIGTSATRYGDNYSYTNGGYYSSFIPLKKSDGSTFDPRKIVNGIDNFGFHSTLANQGEYQPGAKKGATLVNGYQWLKGDIKNQTNTVDLNNFSSWTKNHLDGLSFSANSIVFNGTSAYNKSRDFWSYMFGFIAIPNELSQKGGTVTLNANVAAYSSDKGSKHMFLSMVAGDELKDTNINKDITASIKLNNFRYNSSTGLTYDIGSSTGTSFGAPINRTLTIHIRPGDKFVRVSFIHFYEYAGTDFFKDKKFGQKISDVKLTYALDEQNPTIADSVEYNANKTAATIKANITDDISGIWTATIKSNELQETPMAFNAQNKNYTYPVTKDGVYTITAKDHTGKVATKEVTVSGLDADKPVLVSTTGHDTLAIDKKNVSFELSDASDIVEVTCATNGVTINNIGNKKYSFEATNAGIYKITAKDSHQNALTFDIHVTNILKAGANVGLEMIDADKGLVNVTVTNNDWQQRTLTPAIANGSIKLVSNTGIKAVFAVTFDMNKNVAQTINASYQSTGNIDVTTAKRVDGVWTKLATDHLTYGYKDTYKYTAPDKEGNAVFVGWFDTDGVMITSDKVVTFIATVPMTLERRYITKKNINITYRNLAGNVIDIKAYDSSRTVQEILDSKEVTAPRNPYLTFQGWQIKTDDGNGNIEVIPTYTRSENLFKVVINYADGSSEEKNVKFNTRLDIVGKGADANGFMVGGVKVSNSDNYLYYVTDSIIIDEIKSTTSLMSEEAHIIKSTKTDDGITIVSGLLTTGTAYKEVGFILADNNVTDDKFIIKSNLVMKVRVKSVTSSNQFIIALDAKAFASKKVKLYTITSNGTTVYSDAITL